MKKIVFSIIALALVMVSCNSNEDLAGVASVSGSTSASIAAYVADNYPDATIVSTSTSGAQVIATLNTGETVSFTRNGSVIAYANNYSDGLATDSLIVSDSITTDSVGRHHHRGGHGGHGDPAGHGGGHHGEGRPGEAGDSTHVGHPRHFDNEIAVDSLPATINEYVLANYSGYTVIHAQTDTVCSSVVTSVMVCLTAQEPVKLVFDANGAFLMSGARALTASFPEAVLNTITTNYADYTLRKRGSVYTLADGSTQYKAYLKSTSSQKVLFLAADGTVICEK